jgi:Rad3-related DNA helicase
MNADITLIDDYFPLPDYRQGQKEVIQRILEYFNSGSRFVLLEGPTGCGKSAIGYTLAQFAKNTYYLAPQKFLQDQITADFGENGRCLGGHVPMIDLKGRNAYPCVFYDMMLEKELTAEKRVEYQNKQAKHFGCDRGECKSRGESKLLECVENCPYFIQLHKAMNAQICLMNFHSFLFQSSIVPNFHKRELLIIDECMHPLTNITTDIGSIEIGKLVNHKINCKVLSFNKNTGVIEYKPIVRYLKRNNQMTYKIVAGSRAFYATLDHKIYTPFGLTKLRNLHAGDLVIINKCEINKFQQQIILGSLLGDSSLHVIKRIKKNRFKGPCARVKFQHGPKQFRYLDWKYNIMSEHVRTPPKTMVNAGFTKTIRRFSTKCYLYEYVKTTLINNKKHPNLKWLNQINDFGLAIWYMDDGSQSNGVVHFHTEGYTKHENFIIKSWLRSLGFPARVLSYSKRKHKLYYISIGRDGARKLAKRIAQFVPDFMRYKLPLGDWDLYDVSIENIRSKPVSYQPIVKIEPFKQSITYDLEIADNHNYFAGSTLVSNCHVSEDVLLKFIELRISDRSLINKGIYFPKLETVEQYIEYLEEINLEEIIREQINLARFEDRPKDEDEWMSLQIKYGIMTDSDPSRWICQWEEVSSKASRTISLKPIFVDDFAEKYLFNMADHVLLMSATILSRTAMCDALGMDRDTTKMIKLPCFFPVENRPINFRPSGYMSYNEKAKTLPKLAKDVDSLCRFHGNERGIIHTHNFEICQYLLEHCAIDVSSRFLYQRHMDFDGDKNALLERHKSSTNTVIIAPAMHEGLDLKDDLGKFQIICKVPYPSKGDPQISARMEVSKEYYDWRTACKLVQSTGRIIRHENDSGVTYVLDEDFRRFFNRAKNMLPSWWRDSVIW